MWFYQEYEEQDSTAQQDQPKAGPSRAAATSNTSKTPQGEQSKIFSCHYHRHLFLFQQI